MALLRPRKSVVQSFAVATSILVVILGTGFSGARASSTEQRSGVITDDVLDQIEQFGSSKFPNIYAGVTVNPAQETATVYFTRLDSDVIGQIADIADDNPNLKFQVSRNSLASMDAAQDDVSAAIPELLASGVQVLQVGPRISEGMLRIGVHNLSDVQSQNLTARFGGDSLVRPFDVSDEAYESARVYQTGAKRSGCSHLS